MPFSNIFFSLSSLSVSTQINLFCGTYIVSVYYATSISPVYTTRFLGPALLNLERGPIFLARHCPIYTTKFGTSSFEMGTPKIRNGTQNFWAFTSGWTPFWWTLYVPSGSSLTKWRTSLSAQFKWQLSGFWRSEGLKGLEWLKKTFVFSVCI